jgi:NadR type nicotinamide-nucleotide adenylyltransferase
MEKKIKKIAILGAESTGKTTLCQQLAKHYHTLFVPEFARDYFDIHDINCYTIEDLDIIAKKQIELENTCLRKANTILICDTTLITIKIWSLHKFNTVSDYISNSINQMNYDLYLISNNDVPWIEDNQRKDKSKREHIFEMNQSELNKINTNYSILTGINQNRLENAIAFIDLFLKTPTKNE